MPSLSRSVGTLLAFPALLALLAGCGGSRSAERPPVRPLLVPIPPPATSTLRLPVEVDLDFLGGKVLQSLPRPLVSGMVEKQVEVSLPGGFGIRAPMSVEFRHRAAIEALDARMDGDLLVLTARVAFVAGGSIKGGSLAMGVASCGERPGEVAPAIDFTLRGHLGWGANGAVRFAPEPWTLKWVRPCELTAFRIRLEDILDLPLVRTKIAQVVDQSVARLPEAIRLRPLAEQAWRELGKPREVAPGLYLVTRPESLLVGPLVGHGKTLTTSLTLCARPFVTGSLSPADTAGVLPPLRVDSLRDAGFRLDLVGAVPLSAVDSILTSMVAGRTFPAGGRTLEIARLRVWGGGDRAVIAATLRQPFRGEVFLRGVPEYDSAANAVRFAHLDFDVSSRSLLVKSAAFLLHGSLQEAIQQAAVVPLGAYLPQFSNIRLPAGGFGQVQVGLRTLQPLGVSITEHDLQAWLRAEGSASLAVGPAREPVRR